MTDTTSTEHRHDPDRLSVAEAAARLGVTPDAIRARIRRGTLEAVKVEGEYVVTLPPDAQQDSDATPTGPDTTAPEPTDALVEQLRSEVEYLREQLATMIQQADKANERADILQARLMEHLPALTSGDSPSEAVGSAQSADTPDPGSGHRQDANTTRQEETGGVWGWLRRLLLPH